VKDHRRAPLRSGKVRSMSAFLAYLPAEQGWGWRAPRRWWRELSASDIATTSPRTCPTPTISPTSRGRCSWPIAPGGSSSARRLGRVGDEVHVGELCDAAEWIVLVDDALAKRRGRGRAGFAQRFIRPAPPADGRGARASSPLGAYVLDGQFAGYFARASPKRATFRTTPWSCRCSWNGAASDTSSVRCPSPSCRRRCASRPWTAVGPPSRTGRRTSQPVSTIALPTFPEAAQRWQLPPQNPWGALAEDDAPLGPSTPRRNGTRDLPDISKLDVVADANKRRHPRRRRRAPRRHDVDGRSPRRGVGRLRRRVEPRRRGSPSPPCSPSTTGPPDNEIVPAEETLSALVQMQPRPSAARRSRHAPPSSSSTRGALPSAKTSPTTTSPTTATWLTPGRSPRSRRGSARKGYLAHRVRRRGSRRHRDRGGRSPRRPSWPTRPPASPFTWSTSTSP